jgi:hypothetical protein
VQRILIVVPQSNELRPFLSGLDRLGHPSQPIALGSMACYSIPSLGAVAAVGGHGKTQFAVQCQYLIDRCDVVTALCCVGAAGSLAPACRFGDVVVGECTIEHDYKIRNPVRRVALDHRRRGRRRGGFFSRELRTRAAECRGNRRTVASGLMSAVRSSQPP